VNKQLIADLIKQATVEVPHERQCDATTSRFDQDKFAELLIRKCALLAGEAEENEREGRSTYHVVLDYFGLQDE
jgi:hypothetical protein